MNPFFSIIIPTYNRSQSLSLAVNSVLEQSFGNYELIIIDDGSNDDTPNIIKLYLSNKRIIYHFQQNKGVCGARNKGASLAKGRYLLFLDSDDSVSKNWLSDFYFKLNNSDITLGHCGINKKLPNGKYKIKNATESLNTKYQYSGIFAAGSFCIDRNYFLEIGGYDENIKYGENTELSFRIVDYKPKTVIINEANLFYKVSDDGGSKNWQNKLTSTLYILKKHHRMFQVEKRLRGLYLGVAALAAFKCEQPRLARSLFLQSFLTYPLNWKSWLRLAVIFFPLLANYYWKSN